jgi:hypothetical protein
MDRHNGLIHKPAVGQGRQQRLARPSWRTRCSAAMVTSRFLMLGVMNSLPVQDPGAATTEGVAPDYEDDPGDSATTDVLRKTVSPPPVMLAGFLALAFALGMQGGSAGWVGRLAGVSAVVTVALAGVLQGVDGVALKAAADAWLSAPVAEQPARLAALEGIRWLEWGVRSYERSMQGLTLILLAVQIVLTVRIPRPIGYAMAIAGVTYVAQGVVVGAEGFSANGTIPGLLAFVLDLAWMITLVFVAWQKPSRARSLAATPAVAS